MVCRRGCKDTEEEEVNLGARESFPAELNVVRPVGVRNKVMKHHDTEEKLQVVLNVWS